MLPLIDRVLEARRGGRVERCHTVAHHGSYTNAAHSWGVAMLMLQLWPEDFPRLAAICLSHDVPEGVFGDIPSPTLRHVSAEFRDLLDTLEGRYNRSLGLPAEDDLELEDRVKLKECDRLELYLWAREQAMVGNQYAEHMADELERLFIREPLLPPANTLLLQLQSAGSLMPRRQGTIIRELTK
jgi:5'-deoxynucleotidase YfbR-like HD superfamily hydrolase